MPQREVFLKNIFFTENFIFARNWSKTTNFSCENRKVPRAPRYVNLALHMCPQNWVKYRYLIGNSNITKNINSFQSSYWCVTQSYYGAVMCYPIIIIPFCFCDGTMMLLRSQSISYFNVKRTIWLKGYQNGNHIEPSEQRLQNISIAKNWPRAWFEPAAFECPVHCSFFRNALFLAAVVLTAICGCRSGNP